MVAIYTFSFKNVSDISKCAILFHKNECNISSHMKTLGYDFNTQAQKYEKMEFYAKDQEAPLDKNIMGLHLTEQFIKVKGIKS